jgi:hypothetical protein
MTGAPLAPVRAGTRSWCGGLASYCAALFLIMERGGQPDSRAGGWVAGVGLASWFVAEAAGAYGVQVLADPQPGRGRAPSVSTSQRC